MSRTARATSVAGRAAAFPQGAPAAAPARGGAGVYGSAHASPTGSNRLPTYFVASGEPLTTVSALARVPAGAAIGSP